MLGNGKKCAGISTNVLGKVGPAKLVTGRSVKRSSADAADAAPYFRSGRPWQ